MDANRRKLIIEKLSAEDKSAVKKYVLTSKELEDKINKIVKDKLKNNKELEGEVIEISKNVLTQLFKAFWVKRNFWRSGLTNKSA
jgi:transcriptional regulator NrdR family protein